MRIIGRRRMVGKGEVLANGEKVEQPHLRAEVLVEYDLAGRREHLQPSWHSPDGFEWSGGSGPACLAHSILQHVAGEDVADVLYLDYKRAVIERLDQEGPWAIEVPAIAAWARRAMAKRRAETQGQEKESEHDGA